MSAPAKPLLEFPCNFPLKVMGRNQDDFTALILTLVRRHTPHLGDEAVHTRLSHGGRYLAVNILLVAESQAQLDAIYRDLSAEPRVLMAL
jgi:hypothetical protein